MPFGPFSLQWRTPSPNPPPPTTLPDGITRTYIPTPSGPLELLYAISGTSTSKPPLFFAHGGFGCAAVWLNYLTYFSSHGYPCYAISYRGHGGSWHPSFLGMYFTGRHAIATDLVAGIEEVERAEQKRRRSEEKMRVVLVAHSAGGALAQYAISRGMCMVDGLCLLAGVPGFGSWSCYTFWALSAPLNFCYRFFHPRYLLATTRQVHDAFFTAETPRPVIKDLERLLSPYESMGWPMQGLPPFVTGPDVIQRIVGWKPTSTNGERRAGIAPRLFVLAAEHDVLCTPLVLEDAANRYRAAFHHCARVGKLYGVSEHDVRMEHSDEEGKNPDGVVFTVVKGLGHHLQNHVEWERGAKAVLTWAEKL